MSTPSTEPRIVRVDPAVDDRWASLAATGSVFGSPPWIAAIAQTYGFTPVAAVLDDGVASPAGLAWVEVDDVRGRRIVSLPFCDRVDPVVADDAQWRALVDPVVELGVPVLLRCMDCEVPLRDERFETTNVAAWHGTELAVDDVSQIVHAQVRQNARRAERLGASVRFGSTRADVHTFFDIHADTRRRKYGLLAQPLAFFDALHDNFGDRLVVGLVEHDGAPVAGALYLEWSGTFYYKFGASLAAGLSLRPNELLGLRSLELAAARGNALYDWGLSELDQPGLVAYKRKLATVERSITFLRYQPPGDIDPRGAKVGRLLGEITALLVSDDVPEHVRRSAGDLLYRYFT